MAETKGRRCRSRSVRPAIVAVLLVAVATAARGQDQPGGAVTPPTATPPPATPPLPPAIRPPGEAERPSPRAEARTAAPGSAPAPRAEEPELSATPSGPLGRLGSVLPLPLPAGRGDDERPPGGSARNSRPRPGSLFDPGASGPGISRSGTETFLDGALDPDTGWPFVLLDHFKPRPERVERLWVVSTRECPQVMGTEPWNCLRVRHFDADGELADVDPRALFAQAAGNPVLIQVQGSLTTADAALGGLLWTDSWLRRNRALLPGTVVVAFDWPSQRVYRNDFRDIDEKGRRAFVAAYHLARFVQAFPTGSRVCLLGQSFGGRVVPSALHLLGGGALNSMDRDPDVRLPVLRPDLHVRGVLLAGAADHQWLDPGERLDRALFGCERMVNLYNRRDEALRLYPALLRSNHHHALGKLGLTNHDLARLGPVAARYEEHDLHDLLGREHTLLDAVANRQIARWIAPYVWAPDPGPEPPRPDEGPRDIPERRGIRGLLGSFNARG